MFGERFDDKLRHTINLHPKLIKTCKQEYKSFISLPNLIFYGACGIGKYTLALKLIKQFSNQSLKYEKKMSIISKDYSYHIKISDIHYEIDMSTLGCNPKQLWNEIYNQIIDSILIKKPQVGIILCKSFHEIHYDLLEIFHTFIQRKTNSILYNIDVKFILLTEHYTFIPQSTLKCCDHIKIPVPSNSCMKRCKFPLYHEKHYFIYIVEILGKYIQESVNVFKVAKLREYIYDILTYNVNIHAAMWQIYVDLYANIPKTERLELINDFFIFFKNYNNNYRPIFHLESIFIRLHLACKKPLNP